MPGLICYIYDLQQKDLQATLAMMESAANKSMGISDSYSSGS